MLNAQASSVDRNTICARGRSAVSARARCRQMIWKLATVIGISLLGAAVLLGFLLNDSVQLYAPSVLVLGVMPAAAILLLGAILVFLLSALGMIYDLFRKPAFRAIEYCVCFGTACLIEFIKSNELKAHRVLVGGSSLLVRFRTAWAVRVAQILKRSGRITRSMRALIVREVAHAFLWIRQAARRVVRAIPFLAGWPIRISARLLMTLIEQQRPVSAFAREAVNARLQALEYEGER